MVRRRRSNNRSKIKACFESLTHLWILRFLIPLEGYREFVGSFDFKNDGLAEALGMEHWIDSVNYDFEPKAVRNELRKLYEAGEQKLHKAVVSGSLARNVERLAGLVGLSATDCRILEFAVQIHNEPILDQTSEYLRQLSSVKVFHALSIVLNLPEEEIRKSLGANSVLAKSGLVSMERGGTAYLRGKLDILSENFADHMLSSDADPVSLLRDTVSVSSQPILKIEDFEHLSAVLKILTPYLGKSIAMGRPGVNIFLHGDPGTGKTQLVRVMAKELACELFEVASEDEDGDPVIGVRRLMAFRAAQSFFAMQKALILFDEVEDVFDDGDRQSGNRSTAQNRKAWINRMLEENAVPTFWLSNSVRCLDPAFIRRFDMVFELPVPPRKQRVKIIEGACTGLLDKNVVERVSESEMLAPAVVTRAASVVRLIQQELGDDAGVSSAFELIINNTLETQGLNPIRRFDSSRLPEVYDPAYIQADTDVTQVASGLAEVKAGRLCLYGPPGTGKTAYGRWLAEQMERPIIIKRASDLMSMWVGENEKNIAAAFKEAETSNSVLLLDEVDSYLQDRRGAHTSWEISSVNEMLTQMESFSGIFIASTNLMNGLDQASLRRFDLKIKFAYLKPEQAWNLLGRYCKVLGIGEPNAALKPLMSRLINLTPGDYSTIARRHRFHPIASAMAFVDALGTECEMKEGAKHAIGFIQ